MLKVNDIFGLPLFGSVPGVHRNYSNTAVDIWIPFNIFIAHIVVLLLVLYFIYVINKFCGLLTLVLSVLNL